MNYSLSKTAVAVFSILTILGCGQKETAQTTTEENTSSKLVRLEGKNLEKSLPIEALAIDGLTIPESVVVHKGNVYVANIGGNPLESPKKGFITKFAENKTTHLFVGLLDDPKGFAFLNDDTIIVSDHPNIKILKISTEEVISTLPIDAPGFLNDLVLVDNKTALVSDTGTGLVYHVAISPDFSHLIEYKSVIGIIENGINGLAFNSKTKTLYFVTSTFGGRSERGHIFETTLDNDFSTALNLEKWDLPQLGAGGLDGLVLVNDKLILSDWGIENVSQLYAFNISDRSLDFTVKNNMTSVADMTIANGVVYLPEFIASQVSTLDLSKFL